MNQQHPAPETIEQTHLSHLEQAKLAAAASILTAVALLAPSSAATAAEGHHTADHEVASATESAQRHGSNPELAITTYNILGSNHTQMSREVGGTVKARADRVVKFILGKAGVQASDIVGMQEVERDQRNLFDKGLSKDYGSIPKDKAAENPIFYNKDRFDLLNDGAIRYPYYGDTGLHVGRGKAIWGRFTDKETGKTFVVVNTHPVAWNENRGSDVGGALKREKTAHILANWMEKYGNNHPDEATYLTGDMNSINVPLDYYDPYFTFEFKDKVLHGNRSRIPYCILTEKETGLQDSRDMLRNDLGHCPNTSRGPDYRHQIDWIYLNPTYSDVKSWRVVSNDITRHASDHLPVMVVAEDKPDAASDK